MSLNSSTVNTTEENMNTGNLTMPADDLWERLGRIQRFFNTAEDDWRREVGMGCQYKPDMPPPLYIYNHTEPSGSDGLYQLTQQPWVLTALILGILVSLAMIAIGAYLQIQYYRSLRTLLYKSSPAGRTHLLPASPPSPNSETKSFFAPSYRKPNNVEAFTVGKNEVYKVLDPALLNTITLLQASPKTSEDISVVIYDDYHDTECTMFVNVPCTHTKKQSEISDIKSTPR